ncbi:hypothetical protein [Miltoncostaea marina]|uniref:hypothetical protein n=1 Tax=Miltoncostaea marina TaxID=2843215 RepID=UPI001C3DF1DB|nr:hypothetical protein [Miltoncostaea marina]
MPYVVGQPVVAMLTAPPGVAGLGARIEVPVTRAIVSAWAPAVLADGVWTVTLDAPPSVGDYLLVWRTPDPEPPAYEAFVPLSVVVELPAGAAPGDASAWAPSLDDVAAATPAYTRGGFDDDEEQAGAEQGTFTDDTSPTATHVRGLIAAACAEVAGRVGAPIPERLHHLARQTAVLHVAIAISTGKLPAQTDDAAGEVRSHTARYLAALEELTRQARMGPVRLV